MTTGSLRRDGSSEALGCPDEGKDAVPAEDTRGVPALGGGIVRASGLRDTSLHADGFPGLPEP
jgi:hypothetical protein